MKLKFIGEDGSMGLRHGNTYKVNIYIKDGYIWVDWGKRCCPYDSALVLMANWKEDNEKPKEKPLYHTVTRNESVPQGMTMYQLSKELGVWLGNNNINNYIGYATLHIIAKKYGVSVIAIAVYNNIKRPSELIPEGTRLKIPPKWGED